MTGALQLGVAGGASAPGDAGRPPGPGATDGWVAIGQRVKLNTPGASDGEVTVWQNGRQVFTQRGMTYRTTDELRIDGLFLSTFFGGGDANHGQASSVPAPS